MLLLTGRSEHALVPTLTGMGTDHFEVAQSSAHEVAPVRTMGLRPLIEHTVTFVFAVERGDLHRANRGRANVALARQTAMYLGHVAFSLTLTDVGILFQRDRTTVAHACCVIEDRRDDPNFDRIMDLLERAVVALRHPRFGGLDADLV